MKGESSSSPAALAPGFRFHPTDEELVSYYLKRKVCGKHFRFDAISEIDIYKSEPCDLPGQSRLKSRDLEWYFFSALDKKYGNGSRTNRATGKGYWKTTGKDRPVRRSNRIVGMKKTLVYHFGRAPRGDRTNWVMHEYRLVDEELRQAGVVQDAFVLCRFFQKSGSGPKNGEQYGAPFIEEDWDEEVLVPGEEVRDLRSCDAGDDEYVTQNDLEQNLDTGIQSENIPPPSSFYFGESCNRLENSRGFLEDDQTLLIGMDEKDDLPELPDDQKFIGLPEQYQMDPAPVEDEYYVELNDLVNPVMANFHADPQGSELMYLDATHNQLVDDGPFLEINDLTNPVGSELSGFDMLEEYLPFFDAIGNNLEYVASDFSTMLENEDRILDQSALTQEVNGGVEEVYLANPQSFKTRSGEGASSSKQKKNPDSTKFEPEVQCDEGWDNTILKRASRMLGSISAPPAFASEFPTKAALGQNTVTHSSSSVHPTRMIRISGMTVSGNGNWSLGKHGDVNFILSYGMTKGDVMVANRLICNPVGLEPMVSMLSGKVVSMMVRSWFYLIFFWVLILSVTFKIGTYIYTR